MRRTLKLSNRSHSYVNLWIIFNFFISTTPSLSVLPFNFQPPTLKGYTIIFCSSYYASPFAFLNDLSREIIFVTFSHFQFIFTICTYSFFNPFSCPIIDRVLGFNICYPANSFVINLTKRKYYWFFGIFANIQEQVFVRRTGYTYIYIIGNR